MKYLILIIMLSACSSNNRPYEDESGAFKAAQEEYDKCKSKEFRMIAGECVKPN